VHSDDALTEVERPLAHLLEATKQTALVRLYGNPAVHRLLPTPIALRLAALRGWTESRLSRGRLEAARRDLETLLGKPVDERAARRRVVDEAVRTELQWRPWLDRRLEIDGLEHLEQARTDRRGVILASAHLGPFLALVRALAARGTKVYLAGGHRLGEPGLDGRVGRWVVAHNRWVEEAGCRWVRKPGSYVVLRELLRRGDVVWMAGDARGTTETVLAGHPVRVGSGVGRLAVETGAVVIPAFVVRRGYRQIGLLLPPLAPSDDPQEITDRLATVLGEIALAHPEQAHDRLIGLIRREP
jgi:lauroyl/myristoyl acyltransferase